MTPLTVISPCHELNVGDEISATYNATPFHHGMSAKSQQSTARFGPWTSSPVEADLIDMSAIDATRIPAEQAP